ncbi:hypothetical protein ACWD4P_26970, partial [Kitasatospora sp. NPDC002543]
LWTALHTPRSSEAATDCLESWLRTADDGGGPTPAAPPPLPRRRFSAPPRPHRLAHRHPARTASPIVAASPVTASPVTASHRSPAMPLPAATPPPPPPEVP